MKDESFLKELFRLRIFYTVFREFLDVHFSGYVMNSSDEINRQYLQLCSKIENILKHSTLSDFRKDWKPFEHLLDYDPDYPEGDWEYGGRKLCADFANKIEKNFIENGEKEYSIPATDASTLNSARDFIKNYKLLKQKSDKKFEENAEKRGKAFNEKHSKINQPVERKTKNKLSPLVLYPILGWMGIGIILAIANYSGAFVEPHNDVIDISKKYQVVYETWKDEHTLSGIMDGMSLSGKITFHST